MPSELRTPELLGGLVAEQEAEFESLDKPDVLELGGGRDRLRQVLAVEGAAEAVIAEPCTVTNGCSQTWLLKWRAPSA